MKHFTQSFLFTVLMSMVGVNAFGYNCKVDGICYDLAWTKQTATVTYSGYPYNNDYTGHYGGGLKNANIIIPSTITYNDVDYTVTAIGDRAFYDSESSVLMSSITIPSTVISIGDQAFWKCTNLTDITIPTSVTSIGSSAFYGCSGLSTINIPNSVTIIGTSAFDATAWYNNKPNGMVYAGRIAYKYKGTIPDNTIIEIEEGTVSISPYAFFNCSDLSSVTIPSSVTCIGEYAFQCTGLISVTVKMQTPLSINSSTFSNRANATLYVPYGCKAAYEVANYWKDFKEIIEMPDIVNFEDAKVKNLCVYYWDTDGDGELSKEEAAAVTSLGEVFKARDIKSFNELQYFTGLTSIGDYAFSSCQYLTSVSIPNSVISIDDSAFRGCEALTSIALPDNVTKIGDNAFRYCCDLTTISIPNNLTIIGGDAFNYCSSLTSINIPNGVTKIGRYAFKSCSSLTSISIPNSLTSISDYTFCDCTGLTSVTIPNSVTNIGNNAFNNCI